MKKFFIKAASGYLKETDATSWEDVDLYEWSNCGIVEVMCIEYKEVNKESKRYDTDWSDYGPKGWIKL